MSDPIFLRNLISNTVYAEQINSAQIQGQAAARERALRVQQESIREKAMTIEKLEESARLDVDGDGEGSQGQYPEGETEEDEFSEEDAGDQDQEEAAGQFRHIDLTI